VVEQPFIDLWLYAFDASEIEMNATMKNFLDQAHAAAEGDVTVTTFHVDTYFKWLASHIGPALLVGENTNVGSRLLSYDLATTEPSRVASVISAANISLGVLCVSLRKIQYPTLLIVYQLCSGWCRD
jgi:hypothetical protein